MAASLQQTPISFRPKLPSAPAASAAPPPRALSFTGSAAFPTLRHAVRAAPRRGGGASGARMAGTAAASYALALADLATGNGTLDATNADVEKVEKFFSDPEVFKFFVNPTIDDEKKLGVVSELAESSSLQPHTANFLNILVESRRVELVGEIVKEFEIVYNTMTDTELAVVTSVVPLESQHLTQIAKQVQKLTGAKNVRIKTAIDPSLVAGFTVRYGSSCSKLIDMSVKKQLEEIAAQLDLGDIKLAV